MTRWPVPASVQAAFADMPTSARKGTLLLRELILTTAAKLKEVGRIEEALRWGQPAFLTPDTKAGCSLRVGVARGGGFGLFVQCRSGLIEQFREATCSRFTTEGTRSVIFQDIEEIEPSPLIFLIGSALRYHLPKAYDDENRTPRT